VSSKACSLPRLLCTDFLLGICEGELRRNRIEGFSDGVFAIVAVRACQLAGKAPVPACPGVPWGLPWTINRAEMPAKIMNSSLP